MTIAGIDHVQLAMPAGREDEARAFYVHLLGIPEKTKPAVLAQRGGAWFENGAVKIHLGVEADFRPARKAHPALLVSDLRGLVERLRQAGVDVVDDELAGCYRVYVSDPFGNRLELIEALGSMENRRDQRENVVRRHIAAENTGDLDAMIASFHRPRYHVVPIGAVSDGEAAVRALIAGLLGGFPDFHFEPEAVHHADDAVIVEARMTGTHRGEWAGLAPRGGRMDVRVACVFDFEGTRLVNETVYFDFATLARQLGAE